MENEIKPEITKKGKMNCQEKEQVVRIIKATAQQKIRKEVPEIVSKIKSATVKSFVSRDSIKKLLNEWKKLNAEDERLTKELNNLNDRICKSANRCQCEFDKYKGEINPNFPYNFHEKFEEKINNKADEVILRVLSSGSSREAMGFIKELREFRLS